MKHKNLAIFVPHIGCPNQCSFCDQRVISGKAVAPSPQYVSELCRSALAQMGEGARECEIAFFGGSFTAIDMQYMVSLLEAACTFVGSSGFLGIRISTRPDAIDESILALLKQYKVTAIELGAQSMDDEVLRLNQRGHSKNDVIKASEMIKNHGFELGLQMMLGLYSDTPEKALNTAQSIIDLKPDTVRIYPTIVIRNTLLAQLLVQGEYQPLKLDEAITQCAEIMQRIEAAHIKIIRVGLNPSRELEEDMLAGPYHPAFRELCESHILLQRIISQLNGVAEKELEIGVHPKDISKATGQKRENIRKLNAMGYQAKIVSDTSCTQGYPRVSLISSV